MALQRGFRGSSMQMQVNCSVFANESVDGVDQPFTEVELQYIQEYRSVLVEAGAFDGVARRLAGH